MEHTDKLTRITKEIIELAGTNVAKAIGYVELIKYALIQLTLKK